MARRTRPAHVVSMMIDTHLRDAEVHLAACRVLMRHRLCYAHYTGRAMHHSGRALDLFRGRSRIVRTSEDVERGVLEP